MKEKHRALGENVARMKSRCGVWWWGGTCVSLKTYYDI